MGFARVLSDATRPTPRECRYLGFSRLNSLLPIFRRHETLAHLGSLDAARNSPYKFRGLEKITS